MKNKAYITAYNSLSPLGNEKEVFKNNLICGSLCISEIKDPAFLSKSPTKYLGLIPNQSLESQFNNEFLPLINQKKNWIKTLFSELPNSNDIDTVILVHNYGPNPAEYSALSLHRESLLYKEGSSLLNPSDFTSYLQQGKYLSQNFKIINFHNTCSSVAASVVLASNRLKIGIAKKVLIVAFENSNNNWLSLLALNSLGVLNTKAQNINEAIVPFSSNRAGFVKADALGFLLLESCPKDDSIAEVLAGKYSCDSSSLTDGIEDGSMVARTMGECLKDAGIDINEVDYINAHGSGTYLNDIIEVRGIKTLFGSRAKDIYISSTKSQFGHALCATGVVEISAVCAMFESNFIAANINCDFKDKECDLNFVKQPIQNKKITTVVKNSFGFGGYNSSILLKNVKA